MDLSIIIVNRNTKGLLLDCVESVYKTVPPLSFEVIVVDNGSTDGSVEELNHSFPGVECIKNSGNLGFAKANNQAIRRSAGRYVALLNTDTVLTPGALDTIVKFMDADGKAGISGGQLLNGDGSLQNSIANIPTLATELLNKSLLKLLFPKRYPGKKNRFERPTEVESVIGACMVVSRKAMEKTGLLDESYFFFLEETDWCLAMKKNGFKVFFLPGARIYHLQGQTAKKNLAAARVEYWKSRYVFFSKHYSPFYNTVLKAGLLLRLCLSIVLQLLASASPKTRGRLSVNWTLLLWHIKGCPGGWGLSGPLRAVKPA
jgi:GT2 family glycosyltransferase